jgi:single-stranded-DNA-specific exonuclease
VIKMAARMQKKVWSIRQASPDAPSLAKLLNITPTLAQLLINRQISTETAARAFLSPKLTDLIEPAAMAGVTTAARRIREAVQNNEKIAVYGDYDVDGITGVAILWHLLKMLNAQVTYYIPHRIEEGYGLNSDAIAQLAEVGVTLLITVDCGITAFEEVEYANSLRMDVIITDHHQIERLPNACAIVHPAIDASYGNPNACGAMAAFKLAWAIADAVHDHGPLSQPLRDYLVSATTLAGIGTIADVVDLRGENRVIAGFGLRGLTESKLYGIKALVESAQLQTAGASSYDVAFKLAPTLNAAGRMGHARLAVELLTTDNEMRAYQIAQYLRDQNRQRQKCQRDIFGQAKQHILQNNLHHPDRKTIVLSNTEWHSGVIGIVASRIIDEFNRPTVMINISNGIGHGSGRSIEGFNLYQGLAACAGHLISFGGHEMAAGLRIETDKIPAFAEAFEEYARNNMPTGLTESTLDIEAEVSIRDFNDRVMRELALLEPFGQGNPRPIFATRSVKRIAPPRRVGAKNEHLQVAITDGTASVRCIGFDMGNLEKKIVEAESFDITYEPQINTFNGTSSLQFVLTDIRFD